MSQLPEWPQQVLRVLALVVPYLLWFLVCLLAINWNRMGPTLREGAWVPLVLLVGLVALVWSRVQATSMVLFGVLTVPNFWWQLGAVGLLAALGLFAGYLQLRYGWAPAELPIEPPAHEHGHEHGPGHAHAHH